MSAAIKIHLPSAASIIDVPANPQDEDMPLRKKSSHGRKLPVDHIPRPRNAFILFRTNFVEESKLTRSTEADNRNISKIAGAVWRALPPEQKLEWHKKATEEKEMHKQKYPNYKYRPVLRRENVCRRKVKQKLWEGIDSDGEDDVDLASSAPPSAAANLPPVDFTTPAEFQRLESFKHEQEDPTPLIYASWSSASTSLSLPSTPTMAHSYDTPSSYLPNTSPDPSAFMPLPSSSAINQPRDRCDVIAELYAKGWRGEELEAEIRRREEEGRRRRGVDTSEESKPATVLTMSKAKVRDMGRRLDQEAKEKRALLLKAAMERWKTLKANSRTNVEKSSRQPLSSTSTRPPLRPPVRRVTNKDSGRALEPEGDPDVVQGVPLTIFPPSSCPLPKPHRPQVASEVYGNAGDTYRQQWSSQAKSSGSRPNAAKRQRLDVRSTLSNNGISQKRGVITTQSDSRCSSTAPSPVDSPFDSPILYPHVPSPLSPSLVIQAHPLTFPPLPSTAGDPLISLCQPSSQGQDTHRLVKNTLRDSQQPQDYSYLCQSAFGSSEELIGTGLVSINQSVGRNRGHKRKRSISQPSSPTELNRVYAQLGVQTVYPHPPYVQGWVGTPSLPHTQSSWLADITQHHRPPKPASPSARSAPDVPPDSSSYEESFAPRSQLSSALRPTRSLIEGPTQEGSKWDQACRRWEDRGGPLNFGSAVYNIAGPSKEQGQSTASRTLTAEFSHYEGGTVRDGVGPIRLGSQRDDYGPGAQWSPGDGCHSTSFTPIDIGVQYTFSPEHTLGRPVAESWTESEEGLRHALVSALMDLEAESESLSPEQMMLMTPSQSSESFGHSSQSLPPSDSSMTMAAEFGGHELGLGLVYTAQSPAESSF